MEDKDKLRILIPHWIEHNDEHAREFRDWANRVKDTAPEIFAAAEAIALANESLLTALENLGRPDNNPLPG